MKKVLWTLNINNYLPELTKLTYKYLKLYADKIGAEFKIITERKFPKYSITYEKLQIYELGKINDWNIFIDSDALIHPDFFDLTGIIQNDTCFHMLKDYSPVRYKLDKYAKKDGRFISACNWFVISNKKTHNLWKPAEFDENKINDNIYPTLVEKKIGITQAHLQDDYALTHNIAKYRLKHTTYPELIQKGKINDNGSFWFHNYELKPEKKLEKIILIIDNWQ